MNTNPFKLRIQLNESLLFLAHVHLSELDNQFFAVIGVAGLAENEILHGYVLATLSLVHDLLHCQELIVQLLVVQLVQLSGRRFELLGSGILHDLFVLVQLAFLLLVLLVHFVELLLQTLHLFFLDLLDCIQSIFEKLFGIHLFLFVEHSIRAVLLLLLLLRDLLLVVLAIDLVHDIELSLFTYVFLLFL